MFVVPSTVGPPSALTLIIRTPVFGVDLTTVTALTSPVQRRDGSRITWTWTIVSQTPRELVAQYTFTGTEITSTGTYYIAPTVTVPGGSYPVETVTLFVASPFAAAPKLEDTAWIATTAAIPAQAPPQPPNFDLPFQVVSVGIGAPAQLQVTYAPGNSTLTFSAITGAVLTVARPDGSVITWTGTVLQQSNSSVQIGYVFDDTQDINLAGVYSVGVQLVIGTGGLFPANPFQLLASNLDNLENVSSTQPPTPNNPYPIISSVIIGTATSTFTGEGLGFNGQSLVIGFNGSPLIWTASGSMLPHLVLHDSTGSYTDFSSGNANLSLIEAIEPFRTLEASNPLAYPLNIAGETAAQTCRAIRANALAAGMPNYIVLPSVTGQGGEPYSVVGRGGSGNAYQSLLNEFSAQKRLFLAANPGKTYGVGGLIWEHGEADATAGTLRTVYASNMKALQSGFQADVAGGITGQFQTMPLFMGQQNSSPAANGGVNSTSTAMLDVHDGVNRIVYAPKYWLKYGGDFTHPANSGEYQKLEEKRGQIYIIRKTRGRWDPVMPLSYQVSGNVITVTMNVPFGPLVFDATMPQPHLTGPFSSIWALGQGFEVYDHVMPASSVSTVASTSTPVEFTFSSPHPYNTGDVVMPYGVFYSNIPTATYINQPRPITVLNNENFQQTGTTGQSGTFGGGNAQGLLFRPLVIQSVPVITMTGQNEATVAITVDRPPANDLVVSYAIFPDCTYGQLTGGYANNTGGCGGRLRDSDPYIGPDSGVNLPNWCVQFNTQVVP